MGLLTSRRNYYYLVSGLPDLALDTNKLAITSLAFKKELEEQLHPEDYNLVKSLYLHFDNKNILKLLLKQTPEKQPLANYSIAHLNEQIKEPLDLIDYLQKFVLLFNEESFDRTALHSEKQLQSLYYKYLLQINNKFLKQWFQFEYGMKNLLVAVNSRKLGLDYKNQLISIGEENEVYRTLLKGVPKAEALSDDIPFATDILTIATSEQSITDKEKALDNLKWKFLDEHSFFNYFTIEKILAFVIKLKLVERWLALDRKTGEQLFHRLLNDLKENHKFTAEFSIKSKKQIQ
jgi:hypothetical protein